MIKINFMFDLNGSNHYIIKIIYDVKLIFKYLLTNKLKFIKFFK